MERMRILLLFNEQLVHIFILSIIYRLFIYWEMIKQREQVPENARDDSIRHFPCESAPDRLHIWEYHTWNNNNMGIVVVFLGSSPLYIDIRVDHDSLGRLRRTPLWDSNGFHWSSKILAIKVFFFGWWSNPWNGVLVYWFLTSSSSFA